jgi:hypothetical protein
MNLETTHTEEWLELAMAMDGKRLGEELCSTFDPTLGKLKLLWTTVQKRRCTNWFLRASKAATR